MYLALILTLLALVTPPAAAVQNTATVTFLNGPADFCAQSTATETSLYNGYYVYTSAATVSFHYGCSSVLDWPSGALAARATMYQNIGGTYMICRQQTAYTYNPSPYQSAAIQQNYWMVCSGTGQTIGQSISWVLVGYPPVWQQGGAYTAPTPL